MLSRLTETDGRLPSRSDPRGCAGEPATIDQERRPATEPRPPGSPPVDDEAWRSHALCRGLGAELFFPVGVAGPDALEQAEAAKAVCRVCPVREPCLEFSLATNQLFGVWGGRDEEERRPLRLERLHGAAGVEGRPTGPRVALG